MQYAVRWVVHGREVDDHWRQRQSVRELVLIELGDQYQMLTWNKPTTQLNRIVSRGWSLPERHAGLAQADQHAAPC